GRMINSHQRAAYRVVLLAVNLADQYGVRYARKKSRAKRKVLHVSEKQPNCRVQGDGQNGGNDHGKILGECQGFKKPALLSFQRKNGHEGNRYDQKGEKARSSYLLYSANDNIFEISDPAFAVPVLELFMSLLDNDDGGVHHGAHSYCDPAKGHDVGRDIHPVHRNERDYDRNR